MTTKRLLLTVILGLPELLSEGCARLSISNTTVGVLSEALVSVCVKLHRKYQYYIGETPEKKHIILLSTYE